MKKIILVMTLFCGMISASQNETQQQIQHIQENRPEEKDRNCCEIVKDKCTAFCLLSMICCGPCCADEIDQAAGCWLKFKSYFCCSQENQNK